MSTTKPTSARRRGYDSSRRKAMAADTRACIHIAAAELFATRGWKATGMRDIAKAAGVSVETVYATAGTKTELLLRVIDEGIVGDDAPVPLSDRPEFLALGQGSRADRLSAIGRLITQSNQRIAALNRTFAHAAAADEEVAGHWRDYQTIQRSQYAAGVRLALGRKPRSRVVDGIWALGSSEVYLLLCETAGWTTREYQAWVVEQLDHLLPPTSKDTP